jgi:hypothetical protein
MKRRLLGQMRTHCSLCPRQGVVEFATLNVGHGRGGNQRNNALRARLVLCVKGKSLRFRSAQ